MFSREVRLPVIAIFMLAMFGLGKAGADLPRGVTITTTRPANTFIYGEGVQFLIRCDRPLQLAHWSATRHTGDVVASGTMTVGGEAGALLRIRERLGRGYYTLKIKLASGEVIEDVFCVLPDPREGRGDGGIFGLGYKPRNTTEWDIYEQIGARHVRAEFPWPEVEREPGRYDLEWVDEFAAAAQQRGIQLTVLTGHTPRHYGQMPIDAEGRVARAWYTWQPERTIEWYRFIDTMAARLLNRRTAADPAHPSDTLPRTGRPLVIAWEIWSEADQNFYYGDWDRYLDMLRIAWAVIRSREHVPVVYGSCGHMTQINYTFNQGCADYFDMVAYHPHGSDPDYELMHWFRNMPQAMLARGAPRDTAFTECDFHAEDSAHEPGFILRLYATLRAWRQPLYVRSGCTGGVISTSRTSYALIWQEEGRYVPRPAMVAFAVARWLLEPAQYIGPLQAPEGTRMELFMRGGVPMVVAWTEAGSAQVQLKVGGRACVIDCLGAATPLHGPSTTVTVSQDAVAVWGVSVEYVRAAVTAAVERWLTTELGHESPHNSSYVDPLEVDAAACIGADFAGRVRAAVATACDTWERRPPHAPAALFEAQRVVGQGMVTAALSARAAGELGRRHRNTIWRLAQFVEELGAVADGVGARWRRMHNVSPGDMAKIRDFIRATRDRVPLRQGGAQCPFAERLLDRAEKQLAAVSASGGHHRGAWWAAVLEARAAHALLGIEEPRMLRTFAVAVFPDARPVTKGKLVSPGEDQKLLVRVYNFQRTPIYGSLELQLPSQWAYGDNYVSFTAPAGGPSEPEPVPYAVPEEPTPWVRKIVYRPWRNFEVDLPPPLPPNDNMAVSAILATSRTPALMGYQLFVGSYPSGAASMSTQVRDGYPTQLRRPSPIPAVSWLPVPCTNKLSSDPE